MNKEVRNVLSFSVFAANPVGNRSCSPFRRSQYLQRYQRN